MGDRLLFFCSQIPIDDSSSHRLRLEVLKWITDGTTADNTYKKDNTKQMRKMRFMFLRNLRKNFAYQFIIGQ
ncbi:hypothetical protein L1987_74367 [Smallanthus sonchifolius]|uniref:Uncharacterized protein n=1 Tax=Smallanthus sonchifolius TaxID=185202 RepID=A0ACB9A1R4_9ASTR|nr:hypothetical protein L1987_74367 [Smallanthus sonchifolius]